MCYSNLSFLPLLHTSNGLAFLMTETMSDSNEDSSERGDFGPWTNVSLICKIAFGGGHLDSCIIFFCYYTYLKRGSCFSGLVHSNVDSSVSRICKCVLFCKWRPS